MVPLINLNLHIETQNVRNDLKKTWEQQQETQHKQFIYIKKLYPDTAIMLGSSPNNPWAANSRTFSPEPVFV